MVVKFKNYFFIGQALTVKEIQEYGSPNTYLERS